MVVSGVGPDLTATMNGNYDPPIRYCANILLITHHRYTQIFLHLLSTDSHQVQWTEYQ